MLERMEMMKPVGVILDQCLNLQPGEQLLVLADTDNLRIGQMFALAGQMRGAETIFLTYKPRSRHGEDLPGIIAEAMKAADAIVAPTAFSVNHTSARKAASDAGARLIFFPGCKEEMFLDGCLDIDFIAQSQVIADLSEVLEHGREIHLTSNDGRTDLTINITDRHAVPQNGICHAPGTISPPPCIETAVAPVEYTTQGVVCIDGAVVPGGEVLEPFMLTFENGRIVSVDTSTKDGRMLEDLLASYDDKEIYSHVELGFGLNPKAKIGRGVELEDEGEFGTIHLGIGNGITFGSTIRASGHIDLVVRHPIVTVDGKVVLKDRKLSF
ncbi:aminopeptidase [Paracoccus sp. Z330]|uniref:Aminopeptidase n=1 Tax=Paracoccus onchidii TaxID=3017813 RepID=A0ABT4ZGK3_9RHOB|nr:aminopeptidase [Paracoccus onchidii]MDB6178399.1 aminopeptidase [Paracoccus onchidii]